MRSREREVFRNTPGFIKRNLYLSDKGDQGLICLVVSLGKRIGRYRGGKGGPRAVQKVRIREEYPQTRLAWIRIGGGRFRDRKN